MSLFFSDRINGKGIIQTIEKNCGFNRDDIALNPTLLADFTADVNLALDAATELIFQADGYWEFDDSNYADYPFIQCNLAIGQRDYPFVRDGKGNLVLQVYRVMVADITGVFREIYPVNQETRTTETGNPVNTDSFINGKNTQGTPQRYDKTAMSIFLDPIPSYNLTNGLKVFINREASYFVYSDTTKSAGIAGIFHEYLALRPSYQYAYRKGLENVKILGEEMTKMERAIQDFYSQRDIDTAKFLRPNVENNH